MAKLTTRITSSIKYYVGDYNTPIFDRDKLHTTAAPLLDLNSFDLDGYGCLMSDIGKQLLSDTSFESKCRHRSILRSSKEE